MIGLVDKVMSSMDKLERTVGNFLDLSKEFDTIDYDILFCRLQMVSEVQHSSGLKTT